MIAAGAARKAEQEAPVASHHQDAALLKSVALLPARPVAREEGPQIVPHGAGPEQREQTPTETRQLISATRLVREDRNVADLQVLLEGLRGSRIAAADDRQIGPEPPDLGKVRPQIGHLPTTEHSAELPDEDQHTGPLGPRLLQPAGTPVDVLHLDFPELAADTIHAGPQEA